MFGDKGSSHVHIDSGGSRDGVIKIVGQTQLPIEFITIGKTFEEALGRCVMRDDHQRNAVIALKHQLDMFAMSEEIQGITNWLNASSSVGGYNRIEALEGHTGSLLPEGIRAKVSKETRKSMEEIAKYRAQAQIVRNDNNMHQQ